MSLGQVVRQGVALQFPHLIDDPPLADLDAQAVVVVGGIDAVAGLDDLKPIGQGQADDGGLVADLGVAPD